MLPITEQTSLLGEREYQTPVLHVYGTVAAVTSSLSMAGATKDGGPNNSKT